IIVQVVLVVDQQGRVVNVLNQSRAKGRRGNAEDDVVGLPGQGEAGLPQAASSGIGAAGDGEQVFDPAVRGIGVGVAIRVKEEGKRGFTHRSGGGDKTRYDILGAVRGGIRHLGIGSRRGATRCWLRMTKRATPGVEAWS